jgi:hypothetical protein
MREISFDSLECVSAITFIAEYARIPTDYTAFCFDCLVRCMKALLPMKGLVTMTHVIAMIAINVEIILMMHRKAKIE